MDDNLPLSPSGCLGNTVSGKSILPQNGIPDRRAVIGHNSPIRERACAHVSRPDLPAEPPRQTLSPRLRLNSICSRMLHTQLCIWPASFLHFPSKCRLPAAGEALLRSLNAISEAALMFPPLHCTPVHQMQHSIPAAPSPNKSL